MVNYTLKSVTFINRNIYEINRKPVVLVVLAIYFLLQICSKIQNLLEIEEVMLLKTLLGIKVAVGGRWKIEMKV